MCYVSWHVFALSLHVASMFGCMHATRHTGQVAYIPLWSCEQEGEGSGLRWRNQQGFKLFQIVSSYGRHCFLDFFFLPPSFQADLIHFELNLSYSNNSHIICIFSVQLLKSWSCWKNRQIPEVLCTGMLGLERIKSQMHLTWWHFVNWMELAAISFLSFLVLK